MGGVRVHVDTKDTTGSAEFVVDSAEIDLLDTELTQHGGTHDARLHGNVKCTLSDQ